MIWYTAQHWHRALPTLKTVEGDFSPVQHRHGCQVRVLLGNQLIPSTRLRRMRLETDPTASWRLLPDLRKTMAISSRICQKQKENAETFVCPKSSCIYADVTRTRTRREGGTLWYIFVKTNEKFRNRAVENSWTGTCHVLCHRQFATYARTIVEIFCTSEQIQDTLPLHWSILLTSTWRWIPVKWKTHVFHTGSSQNCRSVIEHWLRAGGLRSRCGRQAWCFSALIESTTSCFQLKKRTFTEAIRVFLGKSCTNTVTYWGNIASVTSIWKRRKTKLHVFPERQRCYCSLQSYACLFARQGCHLWRSDFVREKPPCRWSKRRQTSHRTTRFENSRSTRSSIRWSIDWTTFSKKKKLNMFWIRLTRNCSSNSCSNTRTSRRTTNRPTHFRATTPRSSGSTATWRGMTSCSSRIVSSAVTITLTMQSHVVVAAEFSNVSALMYTIKSV